MRSIGALFVQSGDPMAYAFDHRLTEWFDVILHVERSTASSQLPFRCR